MLDQVEADIIATIKQTIGQKIREVTSHPGHWGADTIKHMVAQAPSVYIGFSSGNYESFGGDVLKGKWHVYLVANSLNGQHTRGQRALNVYQMLQALLPALHELDLKQTDVLRFQQVKNLFSFAEGKRGVCCYEMIFDLKMQWPDLLEQGDLDDWLSYNAKHFDVEDPEHLLAEDTVTISKPD